MEMETEHWINHNEIHLNVDRLLATKIYNNKAETYLVSF